MSSKRSFFKKNYGFYKRRYVWNRAACICFNFAMYVINANKVEFFAISRRVMFK
jgi:hypothetical protein